MKYPQSLVWEIEMLGSNIFQGQGTTMSSGQRSVLSRLSKASLMVGIDARGLLEGEGAAAEPG